LIRSQNVLDRRFSEDGLVFISDAQADALTGVALQPDDVLLNITGDGVTFGRSCIVPGEILPAYVNQHVSIIRADKKKLDGKYLLAYLTHPSVKHYIESFNAGGSRRAITKGHIESFAVPLAPLEIQHEIGEILGAIDKKIDLSRRANRTLEELMAVLFKSWFLDFDPVAAKRDGKSPVGVPADAIDLFPSHFEESELGPIPQAWRVTRVDEAFELNPKRELAQGEVAPYLDMADPPTTGHSPEGGVRRSAGAGMRFVNGDTLMARITPCLENGKTAFVDLLEAGEVGWGSTEYIVIRSKPPMPLMASYLLARNDDFRAFAIQSMTGSSGRQRVAADVLGSYKLALPSDPRLLKAFGTIVEPFFQMAHANFAESRALAELRDTLLGPLLSGELTIKAAEKVLGAAL